MPFFAPPLSASKPGTSLLSVMHLPPLQISCVLKKALALHVGSWNNPWRTGLRPARAEELIAVGIGFSDHRRAICYPMNSVVVPLASAVLPDATPYYINRPPVFNNTHRGPMAMQTYSQPMPSLSPDPSRPPFCSANYRFSPRTTILGMHSSRSCQEPPRSRPHRPT